VAGNTKQRDKKMIKFTKTLEENTEVRIVELNNGKFSVVVHDYDAGTNFPMATIFSDYSKALAYVEANS